MGIFKWLRFFGTLFFWGHVGGQRIPKSKAKRKIETGGTLSQGFLTIQRFAPNRNCWVNKNGVMKHHSDFNKAHLKPYHNSYFWVVDGLMEILNKWQKFGKLVHIRVTVNTPFLEQDLPLCVAQPFILSIRRSLLETFLTKLLNAKLPHSYTLGCPPSH